MNDIYPGTRRQGRPFWQAEPCPKWCTNEHGNHDHPDDRFHYSDGFKAPLTMEEPYGVTPEGTGGEVESFTAELLQGYRECEPHVVLGFELGHFGVRLTLKEAERLAYILGSLTNVARDTDEVETLAKNLADKEQWR